MTNTVNIYGTLRLGGYETILEVSINGKFYDFVSSVRIDNQMDNILSAFICNNGELENIYFSFPYIFSEKKKLTTISRKKFKEILMKL